MTTYKLGVQWVASPAWTLRAGYAHCRQPIPESEVLFNILAPGVVEDHVTAGLSRSVGEKSVVHLSVMHAFEHTVTGPNPLEAEGRQTIELKMNQWMFDLGLSFGF
ncbi:MAG: hypothetical protein ABIQ65_05650 [Thermoanaerobaculia bacterium]